MPIDPSIAMGYRGVTPPDQLAQYAQVQQILGAQQANQLNQLKMAQAQQELESANALRTAGKDASGKLLDLSTPEGQAQYGQNLLGTGNVKAYQEFVTGQAAQTKAEREARTATLANAKAKSEQYAAAVSNLTTPDDVVNWYTAQSQDPDMKGSVVAGMKPEDIQKEVLMNSFSKQPDGSFAFDPAKFNDYRQRLGIGLKAHLEELDKAATRAETERAHRANEQTAQVRADAYATHMKDLGLNAQSYPLTSQAVADLRIPFSRINSRNIKLVEAALQANPNADLERVVAEDAQRMASARTIGVTAAGQEMAGAETQKMFPIARQYIDRVNSGQFKDLNALSNWAAEHTGDTAIVQLNTALNSIINAYARAINPRGAATVRDKNHAEKLVNDALSKGQLNATLNVMEQEIAAARAGTAEASARLTSGTPAAAPAGGDLKALATSAFGSYDTTKFDYRINPSTGKVQRKAK